MWCKAASTDTVAEIQRLKCYDRHPDPGASGRTIRDYLIFAKSTNTVNKTVVNIAPKKKKENQCI